MNTTGLEEIPGLTQGVQRCESEIALTGRNLVRSGLVDSNKEKPIPSQSHHICIVSYDINLHSVVLWIFYISYHIMIFLIGPCLSNSIILMTHSAIDWIVQGIPNRPISRYYSHLVAVRGRCSISHVHAATLGFTYMVIHIVKYIFVWIKR